LRGAEGERQPDDLFCAYERSDREIVTPLPRGVRRFTGPRTRRRFNEMC